MKREKFLADMMVDFIFTIMSVNPTGKIKEAFQRAVNAVNTEVKTAKIKPIKNSAEPNEHYRKVFLKYFKEHEEDSLLVEPFFRQVASHVADF